MKASIRVPRRGGGRLPSPRFRAVLLLVALAAGAVWLFLFDPATDRLRYPVACPFRAATGLDCPGCGSGRAVHQLLRGHLAAAWRLNPLFVLLLPLLGYAALSQLALAVRGRPLPSPFVRPLWIGLLLATVILFWIVRNTPLYPFGG